MTSTPGPFDAPDDTSAIEAIADLARASTLPIDIGGDIYVAVTKKGELATVDLHDLLAERRGETPNPRKRGTQVVHDATSMVNYLAKHAVDETEIWADPLTLRITAVINAGEGGAGTRGFGDFRAVYSAPLTVGWKAWQALDNVTMNQERMAEHFEDRLVEIVEPDGATMLELAQTLKASKSVQFESGRRLKSGETTLVYKEQVDGSGGRNGQIIIPDTFTILVQPFEGSAGYKVPCRFRYRIREDGLLLSYKMERPEDVLREAFLDVSDAVADGSSRAVWLGQAPS